MLTKITNFIRHRLKQLVPLTVFAHSPTPLWLIKLYLAEIKSQVTKLEAKQNLGWLLTASHPLARKVAADFMSLDQNHLGNWSIKGAELWSTRQLEKNVIEALIDLYHGQTQKLEGYFTSGSTEGNIYAAWQGRNYLRNFNSNSNSNSKIDLIGTQLSHYSIKKAADLLDLTFIASPLNSQAWNLDTAGLAETLAARYQAGRRGFLISLTHGYTQTGTSDDVEAVLRTLRKFKKIQPDCHFYVWIDAALLGFTTPFIEKFTPFQKPEIGAVVVDFTNLLKFLTRPEL